MTLIRLLVCIGLAMTSLYCVLLQRRARSCPRHRRGYGAIGWLLAAVAAGGSLAVWML